MSKLKNFFIAMIFLLVVVIVCLFGFHVSEKVVLDDVNEIHNDLKMDDKFSIEIDKTPIEIENEDGYTYV